MNTIAKPQNKRFAELKEIVLSNNDSAFKWAEALREIRDDALYLLEADTFDEWCREHVGKTARAVQMLLVREGRKAAKKLIAEITGEPTARSCNAHFSSDIRPPKNKRALSETMPVKLDPRGEPVHYAKPPAAPSSMPAVTKSDVRGHVDELVRGLDALLHKTDMSYELNRALSKLMTHAKTVQLLLQPELPGLVGAGQSEKPNARGNVDEISNYCAALSLQNGSESIRLDRTDGEWFFDKMTGAGWKNGGQPVRDWQGTVRAWARMHIFPSQKAPSNYGNTKNAPAANPRNAGVCRSGPDFGEAARRKQELQRAHAGGNAGVAGNVDKG